MQDALNTFLSFQLGDEGMNSYFSGLALLRDLCTKSLYRASDVCASFQLHIFVDFEFFPILAFMHSLVRQCSKPAFKNHQGLVCSRRGELLVF